MRQYFSDLLPNFSLPTAALLALAVEEFEFAVAYPANG